MKWFQTPPERKKYLQWDIPISEKTVNRICLNTELSNEISPMELESTLKSLEYFTQLDLKLQLFSNRLAKVPKWALAHDGFSWLSLEAKLEKYKLAYSFHWTKITSQLGFSQTLRGRRNIWNM